TMYTISLTNEISALILFEWKSSLACTHLSELIRELALSTNQLQFSYNRLNNLIKPIENNIMIRRYFESKNLPLNILSNTLNEAKLIYKSLVKKTDIINENDQKGYQILTKLTNLNDYAIDIFHHLFFDTNEYIPLTNNDNNSRQNINLPINENNLFESSPMVSILRNRLSIKLEDWFSFIEIKSQRNITMSLYVID
ncbi:unnamed protein product, partial [Rotaria sp. Silwood1]